MRRNVCGDEVKLVKLDEGATVTEIMKTASAQRKRGIDFRTATQRYLKILT